MSNIDPQKQSNKNAAVWLAAACALVGLIGLLYKKSFVIGKRGFALAEGVEAQIIACFWLLVSAAFLATLVPNMVARKCLFATITVLLGGGLLGIFGYAIYSLR